MFRPVQARHTSASKLANSGLASKAAGIIQLGIFTAGLLKYAAGRV